MDLAVRQDSLNGVWISSEKSTRRLNPRTVVEWRAPAKDRKKEEERSREKGTRKERERERQTEGGITRV